jgi:hypothetical protein
MIIVDDSLLHGLPFCKVFQLIFPRSTFLYVHAKLFLYTGLQEGIANKVG